MSGEKWGYMQTYTGLRFDPANPQPDQICMEDIATALSRESRYAGHTKHFYSVAQHSLMVCDLVPDLHKLWGLLHDAAEAYLKDLPYPVKKLVPEYKHLEDKVLRVITHKYGLRWPMPHVIKQADLIALATERRDLIGFVGYEGKYAPRPYTIVAWGQGEARLRFLTEFNHLTRGVK